MKILFISQGGQTQDYQRDALFDGLHSLFGSDVVDVNPLDSMYEGADRSQMYGRGFTLYSRLPKLKVDRTDIPTKISRKYFDLVIYGSIHRCQDYLAEVSSMYDPRRVAFIDGEDHPGYLKGLGGIYFKRELHSPQGPTVFPIQFGIPKEKILSSPPEKTRLMAPCDPINQKTYIYTDEKDYYQQYSESYYGATMKKAGWDCLRHYEIMSQWCLPYFRVFDQCPATIMTMLPKRELRLIQEVFDYRLSQNWYEDWKIPINLYEDLIEKVMDITRKHLTTEALALRVLDTMGAK